ncbi:MAG: hypothetical protein U0X39_05650 [Bacteroidales bacterium]
MSLISRVLVLLAVLSINASCQQKKPVVAQAPVKEVYRVPYDTINDDLAGFIAGRPHGNSSCLPRLDSITNWKRFAFWMDSGFTELDTARFAKMKTWADQELVDRKSSTPVFYPFGGPDFLNANIFYPNASDYVMIGLEPVGAMPDLCHMTDAQVKKYIADVKISLKDIFLRSYFITGNMIDALKKNSVNGALPVISLFIKRNGYHIVKIQNIAVDSTGSWIPTQGVKNGKGFTPGVKVDFAGDTGKLVQSVYYFQADISDAGLKNNRGFSKYLKSVPASVSYLKAASYLMHANDFSTIRNTVFEKSKSVLQDDSGIAYRFFDKNVWNIKIYGKYMRPGKEFSWINETDLAKAYTDPSVKPVPFTLGYNWRTRAINLLYAVKK